MNPPTPLAAHLARAVEMHRRWARDNGIGVPLQLFQLVDLVRGGQGGTTSPVVLDLSDDAGVPIALTYDDAGRLLDCSAKTISRLVKDGKLKPITVGASPRIPRSELDRFVAEQMEDK